MEERTRNISGNEAVTAPAKRISCRWLMTRIRSSDNKRIVTIQTKLGFVVGESCWVAIHQVLGTADEVAENTRRCDLRLVHST